MCAQDKSILDKISQMNMLLNFDISNHILNKLCFIFLHPWQKDVLMILDNIWMIMAIEVQAFLV